MKTNYVFSTFTFTRSRTMDENWKTVSKDFNRYHTKLQRKLGYDVQYLRTLEAQRDGYPHIHCLFRFPIGISVARKRFIEQKTYSVLKLPELWRNGFTDHKVNDALVRNRTHYLLKYMQKSSQRRLLKRLKSLTSAHGVKSIHIGFHPTASASTVTKLDELCKKYRVKQTTWSRAYFDPVIFKSKPIQRDLNNSLGVTHGS